MDTEISLQKQSKETILKYAQEKLWEEILIPTGNSLLDQAVKLQSFGLVKDILNEDYDAALRRACYGNFPSIIPDLMPKIKNINSISKNANERTALHFAAMNGMIDTIELLLKHGAQINQMDDLLITPMGLAIDDETCISLSDAGGYLNIVPGKNEHLQRRPESATVIALSVDSLAPLPEEKKWLNELDNVVIINKDFTALEGFGDKPVCSRGDYWNAEQIRDILFVTDTAKISFSKFRELFKEYYYFPHLNKINVILCNFNSEEGFIFQLTSQQLAVILELSIKKEKIEDEFGMKFTVMPREVNSNNCFFKSEIKIDSNATLKEKLSHLDPRFYNISPDKRLLISAEHADEISRQLQPAQTCQQQ